ncbi:MAG TPA: hypothetical protein VK536_05415 [Candidatus Limnocylindrales bacterium]|nr:hypothetical protein [Candidatus Limnocylindrales bacterium]
MSLQIPLEIVLDYFAATGSFEKQDISALNVLKLKGIVPVLKVTRAGTTTSLIKQAVNADKRIVIVEPTHRIGEDVVTEAVKLSNNKQATVFQLLQNSEVCKKLVEECSANERLRKMKWLLRPVECEKCEFFQNPLCELQQILNCEWNVLVLTYQKLKALTLSREHSKVSQAALQKLGSADILIFDEYTSGLLGLTPTIELSDTKYESLLDVVLNGYDEWWEKIQTVAFEALKFGKTLNVGGFGRFYDPLSEEDLAKLNANFTPMWNKVKCLTAKGIDTEFLQEMLHLATCKEMLVRKDRRSRITLTPINPLEEELYFINGLVDDFAKQDKLSILVDAHLPEFDLQEHFQSKVQPFMWGDPNNSNGRIVYFCDSRKISEEDIYHEKTRVYVQKSINKICAFHKDAGRILVICLNKNMAEEVQKWRKQGLIPDVNVTWYRSVETRGVQAEGYVEILIGAPYIPSASYYYKVAGEAGADKATAMNRAFRLSNMHCEFVNASSRVKDPLGTYQSYIYCLGITYLEVAQFLNLYGSLYENAEVKRPCVIGLVKTALNPPEWVEMTKLYQRRDEIADPEKHLPYILQLRRIWQINKDKDGINYIPLQLAFRAKSKEAQEAILANNSFLDSIGLHVEKQGRGFRLKLNDKKPL